MEGYDEDETTLHKWTDYKLISKIGSGAYSTVWEAVHVPTGTKVAIKKETDIFADPTDCKRILREVRLIRQFAHPSIIRLYDVFTNRDREEFDCLYLVLELVDASLKDVSSSPIYLTENQVRKVFYNFMVGLKYLQSMGVLHRDIKPANVLIYENCDVRICDFGLARTAPEVSCPLSVHRLKRKKLREERKEAKKEEGKSPKEGLIKPGSSTLPPAPGDKSPEAPFNQIRTLKKRLSVHVVTRWYRAPEVVLMQRDYGYPIDMWSAGCLFAELQGLRKENVKHYLDRKPLFPGGSCFPLSPMGSGPLATRDQLGVIVDVLGTPTEKDLTFLEGKDLVESLMELPKKERVNLDKLYPAAGKDATDLLGKMLRFNPYDRVIIDECLAHPYFSTVRKPEKEVVASKPAVLEFDDEEKMDEGRLRSFILKEVEYYAKKKKDGTLFKSI